MKCGFSLKFDILSFFLGILVVLSDSLAFAASIPLLFVLNLKYPWGPILG